MYEQLKDEKIEQLEEMLSDHDNLHMQAVKAMEGERDMWKQEAERKAKEADKAGLQQAKAKLKEMQVGAVHVLGRWCVAGWACCGVAGCLLRNCMRACA